MKKFNAGDLSKKPSEVFAAARGEGAIIQHKDRQGKVVEEFVIQSRTPLTDFSAAMLSHFEKDSTLWNEDILKGEHPKYKFDNIEKALKEIKGDL